VMAQLPSPVGQVVQGMRLAGSEPRPKQMDGRGIALNCGLEENVDVSR
jgi:hypothetical protein